MFAPPTSIVPGRRDEGAGGACGAGDNLAARYSALAGDGSQGPKAREAAMLFSAAEHSLNVDEDVATCLAKVSEALTLFREMGDMTGIADAIRLHVTAQVENEEAQAALDLATSELDKFRAAGNARGEAAMLLAIAETTFNNFGSAKREEAFEHATKARQMYKDLQDAKMEGIALLALVQGYTVKATKHDARREAEQAIAFAHEALKVCRGVQDQNTEAKALHALAVAHAHIDELEDAIQFSKQALTVWRDIGISKLEGVELRCLAEWQLAAEQPEEALKTARAALKIFEEVGNNKGWEAASLASVVRAHMKLEDSETALQLAKDAARNFQSRADEAGEVEALRIMVEVHLAKDDRGAALEAAEKCLDAVKDLSKRTNQDIKFEASLLHTMAHIFVAEEKPEKARELCNSAMKLYREVGDAHDATVVLHTLSSALIGMKEYREAIKAAAESRDFFRKRSHKRGHGYSCLACSQAYFARGDQNRAISMTKEALKIFTEERHPRGEADALSMLAEVYLVRGSALKSLNYAREARDIYRTTQQPVKELEELFIQTRAAFWVANEGGVPEKKGEKPAQAWEEALQIGFEALAAARKLGFDRSIIAALFGVGQVYVITRRPDEAAKVIDEALPMAKASGDHRAEANLEVLIAQMNIMCGRDDDAIDPAKRAVEIFRDVLHDSEGEVIALELIRFLEGGGTGPQQQAITAEDSQAGGSNEYQGPTMEDLVATISDVALSLMGVDSLAGDTPLMDAGLDSLASVEFQNNLSKEFVGLQLPSTLVFDFPSVKNMAEFVHGGLRELAGFKAIA